MKTTLIVIFYICLLSACTMKQPLDYISKEELKIKAEVEYTKALLDMANFSTSSLIYIKVIQYREGIISQDELQDYIDGAYYLHDIRTKQIMKDLANKIDTEETTSTSTSYSY